MLFKNSSFYNIYAIFQDLKLTIIINKTLEARGVQLALEDKNISSYITRYNFYQQYNKYVNQATITNKTSKTNKINNTLDVDIQLANNQFSQYYTQ